MKLASGDTLDTLPAAYGPPLCAQKCAALFEHVYESYPERNTATMLRRSEGEENGANNRLQATRLKPRASEPERVRRAWRVT